MNFNPLKALLFFNLVFASFSGSAQIIPDSLEYARGGGVYYEGLKLVKKGDIQSVLSKKSGETLNFHLDRYNANVVPAKIFSIVGGVGIGFSAGTALGNGKVNPIILGSGVGSLLIGMLLNGAANRHLRMSVNAYNSIRLPASN